MNDKNTSGGDTGSRAAPRSPREAIQPEPAPGPPGASRRARHPVIVALSGVFTFLLLLIIAAGAVFYAGSVQFEAAGPLQQPRTVVVPRGQGTREIAQLLEREGVIDQSWIFVGGLLMEKAQGELKAGEYLFPEHASMRDVMDILISGKAILHAVTVPEGYTSQQVVETLRNDPVLVGSVDDVPAEGSLLPETYKFTRGTTRKQMLERMQSAHDQLVSTLWEKRSPDLPLETPEELVILASIVEKETGKADERPRVAAVFLNRLRQGMKLQSDPTILYGLYGGSAFEEPRSITRSQLDEPNPYSTYQIKGLPPTPIANPGRAALEAVANPSRTEELYFVADGTGGHVFSETLDEHNRNVSKWRKIEKQRGTRLRQRVRRRRAVAPPRRPRLAGLPAPR